MWLVDGDKKKGYTKTDKFIVRAKAKTQTRNVGESKEW